MFSIVKEWITFGPIDDQDRQECRLDQNIVKILRAGLYESVQDFMDLFRSEVSTELVHCDTEVVVTVPCGDHAEVIHYIEQECDAARRVTPFFHYEDYDIYRASIHTAA